MENNKQLIEQLKVKAEKSEVLRAIIDVFSKRERTRSTVTVPALSNKLKANGTAFSREDCRAALKDLANLGLGSAIKDSRGNIQGLKNIILNLNQIGNEVKGSPYVLPKHGLKQPNVGRPAILRKAPENRPNVSITVSFHGKPLTLDIPKGFNGKDISDLISTLSGAKLHH